MNKKISSLIVSAALIISIKAENIIKGDSSFESGPSWLVATSYGGGVSWETDAGAAAKGLKSIKIDFSEKDWIHSRMFPLKGGEYTFSVYAKADKDKAIAWLGVWRPWSSVVSKRITLTKEWKRYSVSGKMKGGNCWLCFGGGNCNVWLDAWQLEKGKALSKYSPNATASAGASLPFKNDRVFFKNEAIPIKLTVSGEKPAEGISLEFEVKDTFHNTVLKEKKSIELNEGGVCEKEIIFNPRKNGFYLAKAITKKKGETISDFEFSFVVVDKPVKTEAGRAAFCGLDGTGWKRPGLKRIGVKWLEVPIRWQYIEKKKGKYNWGVAENIPILKAAGYNVKVLVMGVPEWAWGQLEVEESKKWKIKPGHRGFLPSDENMKEWQNFLKRAAAKYGNFVDAWEIGAEDDLGWGRNAFYRKKYPKNVENSFALGPLAERVAAFYDKGIEALRSVAPSAKIGLIRPSGVDCTSRGFTFSNAVLKNVKGKYDYFPLDPYCYPRYIGKGNAPVDAPEQFLMDDIERALKTTAKQGQGQPVYISELGYAVNANEPLGNEYHLDYARKMSRAYLIARLNPKVQFCHWFVIQGGAEAGKARYNMWWGDNPAPIVAAYSAVAQIVENVKESKEINLGPSAKAIVYRKSNEAAAAFWAIEDEGFIQFENLPEKLKITDFVGAELSSKRNKYSITGFPVFLKLKGEDAFEKLSKVLASAKLKLPPVKVIILTPYRTKAELLIQNRLPAALKPSLNLRVNGMELYSKPEKIEIAQSATRKVKIELLPKDEQQIDYALDFGKEHERVAGKRNLLFTPLKKADKIKIDGDISDWNAKNILTIFKGKEHLNPPDPSISWSGDDDLSGRIYCGWDEQNFYFAAAVKDDLQFNSKTDYKIWGGDCLQVAMDIQADSEANAKSGYDDDDIEFGMAFTQKKGQEFYSWHGSKKELRKGRKFAIKRDKQSKMTFYEASIPWSALKFAPELNKVLALNYVILDDDDGNGASYWLQESSGITGGKNPKAFKKFYLTE